MRVWNRICKQFNLHTIAGLRNLPASQRAGMGCPYLLGAAPRHDASFRCEGEAVVAESEDADFVKIDGSYTQDLSRQENQEALKQLLAQLHEQAKQTIVPFVDSATVLATLWQAGVGYIQGQYLQGPSQSMDYNFSSDED